MAVERIAWGGWENCIRLSNQHIEVIATLDVGPRIISFALKGGKNVFYVDQNTLGQTSGDDWCMYGGHRLWHAPEHPMRTYIPDNKSVDLIAQSDQCIHLKSTLETQTGIQKAIKLTLVEGTTVRVDHEMTNAGLWDVSLAIWGLSMMRVGGTAIIPLPERGEHPRDLLPNTRIIGWPYTNFSDPRWQFGYESILLHQTNSHEPQKIGLGLSEGWLGYVNDGLLFVKEMAYEPNATYPDMGCNAEVFTNDWMLEIESLSPMVTLKPSESATHTEVWHLVSNVATPQNDEDVKQHILPFVHRIKG